MANLPNHRNRYTGELLANAVEVCSACHRNFASTRAGDLHRVRKDRITECVDPLTIGLEATRNSWGAVIYRKPVKAVGAGFRATISEEVSPNKAQLLKAS